MCSVFILRTVTPIIAVIENNANYARDSGTELPGAFMVHCALVVKEFSTALSLTNARNSQKRAPFSIFQSRNKANPSKFEEMKGAR